MLDVSIIVVSYNTRELLRQCLESIGSTTLEVSYEIVVVDNASTDGSVEMVKRDFPDAVLMCNEVNVGFAVANNQALRARPARYALLLNSDAMVTSGSIDALVRFMDSHPTAGAVGPKLLNPDGSFQASCADFPSLRGELLLATRLSRLIKPATYPHLPEDQSNEERKVDWVSGACLMVRGTALSQVGLMDEDYFMYSEETDWCYRMNQAGWSVHYLPSVTVVHWSGQSAGREPERTRSQLYQSKVLFVMKHRGPKTASLFRLAIQVASLAKLALWTIASFTPSTSRRAHACQQMRSYALLLREL